MRDHGIDHAATLNLRSLVESAIRAPSGHNLQPWKFRIGSDYIDLHLDRSRSLPVIDPLGRESLMSCGAALFHLRLAMRCAGRRDIVTMNPEPEDPDWIARLQPGLPFYATAEELRLFLAIPHRATNRLSFYPRPVPVPLTADLVRAAQREGADLKPVESEAQCSQVKDLIAEGVRALASSAAFRREMQQWLPLRGTVSAADRNVAQFMPETEDPPLYRGTLPPASDPGELLAAQERQLAAEGAILVVLTTPGDTPADCVAAGQALARVLLLAAANEISATFLSQPIQVERLRPRLREVLRIQEQPQLLLALGYAPTAPLAPRRPIEEVLIEE